MFTLILTVCLAAAPTDCRSLVLPGGAAPDGAACMAAAPGIRDGWLGGHPGLVAARMDCAAMPDLPVLAVREIAPGVHVHIGAVAELAPENRGEIANLSFVVGETVAVIDAGSTRAEGQALLAAIRRVTDRPVSHLILTHMHPDHVLGAEVFAEAGATILAHPRLAEALNARAATYIENLTRTLGPGQMIGTRVVLPTRAAAAGEVIDLGGGRRLVLTPVETAHTDNDLLVRDEGSGTLFTGDLVFRGLTPVVDGSLNGWLHWLEMPPQPVPARIVPGHGPVAATWEQATAAQSAFLHDLRHAARDQIAAGHPMSEAVPAIVQALDAHAAHWVNFEPTLARDATAAFKELEWE